MINSLPQKLHLGLNFKSLLLLSYVFIYTYIPLRVFIYAFLQFNSECDNFSLCGLEMNPYVVTQFKPNTWQYFCLYAM